MIQSKLIIFSITICCSLISNSQIDSSLLRSDVKDSLANKMNMDAVYNRPFISMDRLPVSLGGYAEVNWQRMSTDGISEGHQFQMRRMTLFIA